MRSLAAKKSVGLVIAAGQIPCLLEFRTMQLRQFFESWRLCVEVLAQKSGAEVTRSPNASRLPGVLEPREASGLRARSPPLSSNVGSQTQAVTNTGFANGGRLDILPT